MECTKLCWHYHKDQEYPTKPTEWRKPMPWTRTEEKRYAFFFNTKPPSNTQIHEYILFFKNSINRISVKSRLPILQTDTYYLLIQFPSTVWSAAGQRSVSQTSKETLCVHDTSSGTISTEEANAHTLLRRRRVRCKTANAIQNRCYI